MAGQQKKTGLGGIEVGQRIGQASGLFVSAGNSLREAATASREAALAALGLSPARAAPSGLGKGHVELGNTGKAAAVEFVNTAARRQANRERELAKQQRNQAVSLATAQWQATSRAIAKGTEEVSRKMDAQFSVFKARMTELNRQIVLADETQKKNLQILQHEILQAQEQIAAARVEAAAMFVLMETANEERAREIQANLHRINENNIKLAKQLDAKIGAAEANLGAQISDLADKVRNFQAAVEAGMEADRRNRAAEMRDIEAQLAALKQGQKDEREALQKQLAALAEDNEPITIYTCNLCLGGNLAHCEGGRITPANRVPVTITRGQLKKLDPSRYAATGAASATGKYSEYILNVGRSTIQDVLRGAGIPFS